MMTWNFVAFCCACLPLSLECLHPRTVASSGPRRPGKGMRFAKACAAEYLLLQMVEILPGDASHRLHGLSSIQHVKQLVVHLPLHNLSSTAVVCISIESRRCTQSCLHWLRDCGSLVSVAPIIEPSFTFLYLLPAATGPRSFQPIKMGVQTLYLSTKDVPRTDVFSVGWCGLHLDC